MIEEEILVNLVRGPTTSASNLTKRQTSTLTRILEEHMDEFIHQRMLYSELADELKLVHPGMNAIKRKILAEHVLEAVEALEQKAERINLLQTLLPEGFEVDFWSGGEGEEGEELKQGDWKEDGTRRNGKHDRPSSDDLVFDEYEGRKVVGSRRDPIRRVGPDVRKVDPKEDQEDRGQQVDPTSLLPPQDRPAKQDKAKRSSKRSKPTSTNTGHVDRNREGDDGASRRRSKKVIQATSSGGGVINPFSRARYSPPVVDSQEPPRWEEEEEQDPTKSKRERFEKGEPNDPTPTTNVRTSSHQRLARQQDQRNEVNRSTWPTSWNARR
ncbi:hypothetical protein IE53DRAFT_387970 [Violaceomyces palustris]|uniref:Uncharacterized protein n=1 Tax=Violaceomyces palustris TaxID=1673888 RepID=A0ACD0NVA5_9BASI|nr:hypothetical protein IE53DRAFT_387970 [Violaceomyces palustris]